MYLGLPREEAGDLPVLGPPEFGGRGEGPGFARVNAELAYGLLYFEIG